MRCLVTGAYGFIGSAVVAALRREGVTVVGAGRDLELARRIHPDIEWIACDFNNDVEVAHWLPRLKHIDAVVNCVGILQGSLRDDASRIHADATIALFQACAAAGIKRLVHVSAVSAEADVASSYARSKAKADAALETARSDWLIVKPSLVIGQGSYGGTSLMRGLAGLPFVLPLPGEGARALSADRARRSCRGPRQARRERARPRARRFMPRDPRRSAYATSSSPIAPGLALARRARSWCRCRCFALCSSLAMSRAGSAMSPPRAPPRWCSCATTRLVDGAAFAQASGVAPKGFSEMLRASPATLQDRLHARSFFAVPVLHVTLAAFWILTGILTLMPESFASATALVRDAGLNAGFAKVLVAAASITDILLGALFLLPGWVRRAGTAQLVLSAFYLVGLSLLAPGLWTDHFGPLLKVVPMMAATLVVMAFEEKR